MEKLIINACPVCGSTHLKRVMTCTDFYASGEQFELCSCEDCGFTFTQGVPVEAEIGKYYETPDYISHTDTRKGAMNTIYHYVRSYMLGRKARLVAREAHRKRGRLLDIGTGTGYFADTMARRGWKVEAVEKSPQARAFAKEHFDLDVKPESALKEFAPGSFDVITLWHVMEHLEHLNETWEMLRELLTEKGMLIVAVPNCSSYDAGRYGEYWAAYDVPAISGISLPSLFSSWLPVMDSLWRLVIRCRLMRSMYRCSARNIAAVRAVSSKGCMRGRLRGSARWGGKNGAVR